MRRLAYSFMVQSARHALAAFRRGAAMDSFDDPGPADYALPGHQVQVACALRPYQPVLEAPSRPSTTCSRRERICQRHRGSSDANANECQHVADEHMMLTAMIRDAPETSCASSCCSRVRRPAASGKRERRPITDYFRFGAAASRSGLDRSSARAYKGVVRPGGAGRICGPVTTWGWPGALAHSVCPPLEHLDGHDCGQADPVRTCQCRHRWQGTSPFPVCRR